MTYIVLIFGQLVPVVRLIIFLGNSLSFGSSRFQDQVVRKLSGVYFRLMHDFSLLWIFDILEVICHIFPSPQNKLPLALCRPGRGGGGGSLSFGCDKLSCQCCVPLLLLLLSQTHSALRHSSHQRSGWTLQSPACHLNSDSVRTCT